MCLQDDFNVSEQSDEQLGETSSVGRPEGDEQLDKTATAIQEAEGNEQSGEEESGSKTGMDAVVDTQGDHDEIISSCDMIVTVPCWGFFY